MKNPQYNAKNEIIKTRFFTMLEHARSRDSKTVSSYAGAIHEFEVFTGFKDFKDFEASQAVGFKEYLSKKTNRLTGYPISKSYLRNYTTHVREFFKWLERQKGYSKYIHCDDVEHFNLTRNDRNRAYATNYQDSYDITEILATIRAMPEITELEVRNKAMLSLCVLTTPRISALQTARIASIKFCREFDSWSFLQNPNLVNTKYAKQIMAFFIGESEDIRNNIIRWKEYLVAKGFTDRDPLFPKIVPSFDPEGMQILNIEKIFIQSQTTMRTIFEAAFKANGLPYFKPHSFRHSLVRAALRSNQSPLLISALSENMGHTMDVGTIIGSYGTSPAHERAKVLKDFKLE